MRLVEVTAHCTRCHDTLTVIGVAHDSVGKHTRWEWLSPSYQLNPEKTALIHKPTGGEPDSKNYPLRCGGTLILLDSQFSLSPEIDESEGTTTTERSRAAA
jgi:hypothetical protein